MNHFDLMAAVDNIIELNERLIAVTKQRDGLQKIVDEQCRFSSVCCEYREQREAIEAKLRIELRGHPDSELWGDAGLIAATMRCVDAVEKLTEQRDAQAERIRYLEGATNHANGTPLTKAINQRDRLAMALRELCEALLTDEPRDITELLNKAGDALQSLTTPTQTETE